MNNLSENRGVLYKKDLKIPKILQEEGNITFVELGKRLNISPSTAYIRVRRLRQMGLIKKIAATVDYQKLGYKVRAPVFVEVHTRRRSIL